MNDTEILKKIEEWLKEEVDTYEEYADDIGGVDSFDEGILEGRHECAEELLKQIAKLKGGE
tara:strand:+ start:88 stop:270 length:183 start_codon:yes stop_codon:yes gene_type:complete